MNNKNFKTLIKTILILVLPASILMLSPASYAADWKVWSGGMCQAYFGEQETDFRKESRGIFNLSDKNRAITCGLTRDNVHNTNGAQVKIIYAPDPSSSQRFKCVVYESQPSSAGGACADLPSGEGQCRVFAVGEPYQAGQSMYVMKIKTVKSFKFGHRTLSCNVPAKGRIVNIQMLEYGETDNGK